MVELEAPHLMLLDLDMPRMTGLEVLKRLPKVRSAEDLPVIVMTAHASIDSAVEATRIGAFDFLEKPQEDEIRCNTINAGIYVLEPEIVRLVPERIERQFSEVVQPQPGLPSFEAQ